MIWVWDKSAKETGCDSFLCSVAGWQIIWGLEWNVKYAQDELKVWCRLKSLVVIRSAVCDQMKDELSVWPHEWTRRGMLSLLQSAGGGNRKQEEQSLSSHPVPNCFQSLWLPSVFQRDARLQSCVTSTRCRETLSCGNHKAPVKPPFFLFRMIIEVNLLKSTITLALY